MATWWRLIADQLGISGTGSGSHARAVAIELGAEDSPGHSWPAKITNFIDAQSTQGSWAKRLIPSTTLRDTTGPSEGRLYASGLIAAQEPGSSTPVELLDSDGAVLTDSDGAWLIEGP